MTLLYTGEEAIYVIEHGLLVVCAIVYIVSTIVDRYY